ncbi:MAG TPA: LacI family DNA-binding transcriptional regulator [Ferruginibacter sp.]|nr:LacI family DNA-binding transcriptional regulator [Ferruginibacter sp.]HRE64649.1 LacI family DNA-binding transcriptional regulator [Ferruginibacter sp.]
MSSKLPSTKEIAKRLNVSVSTVSRALNNHPRIGISTKEKVKKLAEELGYEPNTQAIFFKQSKTMVIGVILPSIKEGFFSEAISGMEEAALQHDYTILFGQSYDDLEKEKKIVATMRKKRVDGLIISLSKQTNTYEHLLQLEKYKIPVIYFDRIPAIKNVHKIFCNLYNGTVELIEWLFDKGQRKIAFINGPDKLVASKERLQGYIDGISRQKLKVDMQFVEKTDLTKESTQQAVKKLFQLKNTPNAIICFNDYVYLDAVQCAERMGIKINKEVLFVSYANLPITEYTAHPPVASLEQFPYLQGEKTMTHMINLLNKPKQEHASEEYIQEELKARLIISNTII